MFLALQPQISNFVKQGGKGGLGGERSKSLVISFDVRRNTDIHWVAESIPTNPSNVYEARLETRLASLDAALQLASIIIFCHASFKMSSQESLSELLEKISVWSTQELQGNLKTVLPMLTAEDREIEVRILVSHNSLEKCSDKKSVMMKLVQALLVQCLPYVPTKEIDETLLQHAMPAAKQIFIEVCLELLNWLDCAMQYIMSLGALDVLLVQSAPKNIADILFRSFKHCKDSEALYSGLFQTVSETLTVLFRKTHTLQSHYISALSENFQFNCMFEDELDMLTQVLVLLSTTGELVVGLDAKTMAEQWKGYIRLAERYAEHLRPRLDVASPIRFLSSDVAHNLEKVVNMSLAESKLVVKNLKVCSFELKIIFKLCEAYTDYLGDCHRDLLHLLVTLYSWPLLAGHGELSWPLQIPGVMSDGEPPRSVDLYETVLTHLAGFVMTVSAEQFPAIEAAMLENILQCNVWRAMLAMDLWCLVARYGSAELCFHHVIFLLRILEKFPPGGPRRPEAVFLSSLLGRLFPLLSDEHKAAVCKHFPPSQHPSLWGSLGVSCLPDALKSSVAEKLMQGVAHSLKSLVTDPPDIQLYNQLVKCLPAVPVITEVVLPTPGFISDMVNMWERVNLPEVYTSKETSQQGTQWLHHLATLLCDATVPLVAHFDNSQLLKILRTVKVMSTKGSSLLKLSSLSILKSLGTKIINSTPDQLEVCHQIGDLFSLLLQDKNPLVLQTTLEVFEYFAHVTKHEQIVVLSVKNNKTSQKKITCYLQRQLPEPKPDICFKEYLTFQSQVQFVHKCSARIEPKNDSPMMIDLPANCDKPMKKCKTEYSVQKLVQIVDQLKRDSCSLDLWVMLGKNIPLLYLVNNGLTLRTTIPASKVSIPGNRLQVRHH
uniref:Uncharacterized protein n=1 Tax=Timema genevievae TaxID=629358 RepID=A0A7R9PGJ5_TIMGE|nr:unnamed protein product [Timema genevievae]